MTDAFTSFCELLSQRTYFFRTGQHGSEADKAVAGQMEPLVQHMDDHEQKLAGILLQNHISPSPPVVEG